MDVFVDAVQLLNKAKITKPVHPKHHKSISNKAELGEGFSYFFQHGAAAERYVGNSSLFEQLVQTASSIKGHRRVLGGNAPVMANRFALEGAEVLLASQASPEFKKALRPEIEITGSEVATSDIHLILEYKTGEKWGNYKSVRANRYIIHSDKYNPTIQSLEPLVRTYEKFNPTLLVVGGLQMLDNFPFQ